MSEKENKLKKGSSKDLSAALKETTTKGNESPGNSSPLLQKLKGKLPTLTENEKDEVLELRDLEPAPAKECVHHKKKFQYYCESCEEPICDHCSMLGPHNNQLHRINTLGDAYKSRVMMIHQLISSSLLTKRDQLIAQLYRLDHRIEEIKQVKTIIERDIKTEFSGVLERLRVAEGVKLTVLNHDIAILQRDIERINDIVRVVNQLTGDNADPLNFLLKCEKINDMIEFTLTKPFNEKITVDAKDLPKELIEKRDKIDKINVVQSVVKMKDELVHEMIKEHEAQKVIVVGNITKAAQVEINEWTKLTDKFSDALKNFHKICFYCGCVLDEKNVNLACNFNNRTILPAGFGYTVNVPERTWHGTRRHFFGHAKPEVTRGGKLHRVGIDAETAHRDEKIFKNQYQMFLEVLLSKVRKYCLEKQIKVEKVFSDHDKNKTGFVTHIAFVYLLNDQCSVSLADIEKFKTILDPQNTGKIPYAELVKMINNPKYLAEYQAAH